MLHRYKHLAVCHPPSLSPSLSPYFHTCTHVLTISLDLCAFLYLCICVSHWCISLPVHHPLLCMNVHVCLCSVQCFCHCMSDVCVGLSRLIFHIAGTLVRKGMSLLVGNAPQDNRGQRVARWLAVGNSDFQRPRRTSCSSFPPVMPALKCDVQCTYETHITFQRLIGNLGTYLESQNRV